VSNEDFISEFKGNYDVLLTWALESLHQSIQQIFNEILLPAKIHHDLIHFEIQVMVMGT